MDWALVLGDGLHPLQWVTNNFMHSGFFHLAGNMIFLWTFGLVVEGKLGWWRVLARVLGLAAGESAGMQFSCTRKPPSTCWVPRVSFLVCWRCAWSGRR